MGINTQSDFAAALRDQRQNVPLGLSAWNSQSPERRFGVYRNNVMAGLIGALASRFPVTEKIVGTEFFAGMARAFIEAHPPLSPLLLAYGDGLANFVSQFEPAEAIAYLPDVIRLEAARSHAYHAADIAPMDPALLAKVDPSDLPGLTFVAHPSLSIVRSAHPVVTIWAMNSGDMPLAPIEDWCGEDGLIVRPEMRVEIRRLPEGGAVFLVALAAGACLAEAAEAAAAQSDAFDLSANIAGALEAGIFTAIR